jgi:hypothetical protein
MEQGSRIGFIKIEVSFLGDNLEQRVGKALKILSNGSNLEYSIKKDELLNGTNRVRIRANVNSDIALAQHTDHLFNNAEDGLGAAFYGEHFGDIGFGNET